MPWIPAAIQAGMSIYGAIKGNSEKNKMMARADKLDQAGQEIKPFATSFMDQSKSALGTASNFWTPIAQGDRTKATSILAPDISRINEQADAAQQASAGTRTGAGAAFNASLLYKKLGQLQSIFSALRPQAATQLADIGSRTGQLGMSGFNAYLASLSDAANVASGVSATSFQQGQALGQSMGNLSNQVNWNSLFKGGGNSGGTAKAGGGPYSI